MLIDVFFCLELIKAAAGDFLPTDKLGELRNEAN